MRTSGGGQGAEIGTQGCEKWAFGRLRDPGGGTGVTLVELRLWGWRASFRSGTFWLFLSLWRFAPQIEALGNPGRYLVAIGHHGQKGVALDFRFLGLGKFAYTELGLSFGAGVWRSR